MSAIADGAAFLPSVHNPAFGHDGVSGIIEEHPFVCFRADGAAGIGPFNKAP